MRCQSSAAEEDRRDLHARCNQASDSWPQTAMPSWEWCIANQSLKTDSVRARFHKHESSIPRSPPEMRRSQCFKRAKPASWAARAPPLVALPMPSSDLSRNQPWESVKCMVLSWLWLSLCLDRNSQAAKLCVNQLHFVASLILPKTNPSCKSMVLPRFRTSLNAESTKAASAAFMSAMHLMISLRAWKWRRDCKVWRGASKIQKPMIHLYQHNLTEAACSAAWAASLLPPESLVSSTSLSSFTFGAGVFFCISAKRVISWNPAEISGCKTVRSPKPPCFLFLSSKTPLSMYVQQRNVQKWPIKDQQQTPHTTVFSGPSHWIGGQASASIRSSKRRATVCRTAGCAAMSNGSLPPEFWWWIPFLKAWYTEVEASQEAVNVATWLRLWAGCLALAEWCVPNRWPVAACKRSKQCRAWANVQPLLPHHATRIVVGHWSYNYQSPNLHRLYHAEYWEEKLSGLLHWLLGQGLQILVAGAQRRIAGDGLVVSHSQPSGQLSLDTPLQFSLVHLQRDHTS